MVVDGTEVLVVVEGDGVDVVVDVVVSGTVVLGTVVVGSVVMGVQLGFSGWNSHFHAEALGTKTRAPMVTAAMMTSEVARSFFMWIPSWVSCAAPAVSRHSCVHGLDDAPGAVVWGA